jgi:hypothetical protein
MKQARATQKKQTTPSMQIGEGTHDEEGSRKSGCSLRCDSDCEGLWDGERPIPRHGRDDARRLTEREVIHQEQFGAIWVSSTKLEAR